MLKSFVIKLGKTVKAIRRDGFFSGGAKIGRYLRRYLGMLLSFKSGQVLIVTGGVGDSANYRSVHIAEELNLHNIQTETMIQDHPFLPKFADRFEVFVFHRTLVTAKVAKFIERIKKQNKEIIFETDDLVFDAKFMQATDAYANMSELERKQYAKGVGEEILQDSYVKTCTTTTTYLADILRKYGKQVFVVSNKLSDLDMSIAQNIFEKKNYKLQTTNYQPIKIGYFSGTMSHNKDFATIISVLRKIMKKYPQVKLVLAGPLETGSSLDEFGDRIKSLPFASREKHFSNVSRVDINIVPLELDDPFCESKSELKFFEAGVVGVPTVAVANQTYAEAITDGVDGFVAKDEDEWLEKISKLIEDRDLRIEMGRKAREKALQDYTTKNSHGEEYYEYLKSKL